MNSNKTISLLKNKCFYGYVAVFMTATGLSLSRILGKDFNSLGDLVWAEDGMFALCNLKYGPINCNLDSYNGRFHLLPRLLAIFPSVFPIILWGYVINIFSAVISGIFCVSIFYLNRIIGVKYILNFFISYIWVLMPINGYEVINVYSNSSHQIKILLIIIFLFLPKIIMAKSKFMHIALSVGILSDPTVGLVLIPLIYNKIKNRISLQNFILNTLIIGAGTLIQIFALINSNLSRYPVSKDLRMQPFLDGLFTSFLTFIPGLSYQPTVLGNSFSVYPLSSNSLSKLFLIFIFMIILYFFYQKSFCNGIYMFLGFLTTLIPTLSEGPATRYFVVFNFIFFHSLAIQFSKLNSRALFVQAIFLSPFLINWATAFYASDTRIKPEPEWTEWRPFIQNARIECLSQPDSSRNLIFSPNWPPPDFLREPSSSGIECKLLIERF